MATFEYNRGNLFAKQIYEPITDSQTTIYFTDTIEPQINVSTPFFATIMPAPATRVPDRDDSEIVKVTNISFVHGRQFPLQFTVERAQRGTSAKTFNEGAIIMNGVYVEDLEQSQAVGKSFFSATLTSSVYYIQDARLKTTPENGDSIRVVFGSNWTSGTPKLSLNSGTAYNIYAGNNLSSSAGTATTAALVKTGIIYELTYYNSAWYILNLNADSSITPGQLASSAVTNAKLASNSVTRDKVDFTSFAVPVYMGKVCFNKRTYNNARMVLENKTDFYKATGVSTAITNSVYLTVTLPTTGTYVARVRSSLWTTQNSWDYMLFEIQRNESVFARAMGPKINGGWGFVNAESKTQIANNDRLCTYLNTNGNNFTEGNMSANDSYMLVDIYKTS